MYDLKSQFDDFKSNMSNFDMQSQLGGQSTSNLLSKPEKVKTAADISPKNFMTEYKRNASSSNFPVQ